MGDVCGHGDMCGLGPPKIYESSPLLFIRGPDEETITYDNKEYIQLRFNRRPQNPEYFKLKSRVESFGDLWPKNSPVTPSSLAEAGYFYTGIEDKVTCFYCNCSLHRWAEGDDPFIEHAKHFPDCFFVFLIKGEDFITAAKNHNYPQVEQLESYQPSLETIQEAASAITEVPAITESSTPESSTAMESLTTPESSTVVESPTSTESSTVVESPTSEAETPTSPENSSVEESPNSAENSTVTESPESSTYSGDSIDISSSTAINITSSNDRTNPTSTEPEAANSPVSVETVPETRTETSVVSDSRDQILPTPPPSPPSSLIISPNASSSLTCESLSGADTEKPSPLTESGNLSLVTTQSSKSDHEKKEGHLCITCLENAKEIVFIPCGHAVTCSECAILFDRCILCRKKILSMLKFYL